MKSACANIGELQISEQAFALEKAGLNNDLEFIASNIEQFIETLESLISKISPTEIVTDTDSDADVMEDTAYRIEQLQIVITACEDYDRKAAFAALDSLKEKQWKTGTVATFEEIRDLLQRHSDFEGASELIRKELEAWKTTI
jgi:hypothetical protein